MSSHLGSGGSYGDGDDQAPYEPRHNPYQPTAYYEPGDGSRQAPPAMDGVSIAGMVCALTCCAAPVGVGLGIAGIVRTKKGKRRGRWAAVTGLVVGIIGTLALVAGGIGVIWYATHTVFLDEARAGDCVDIGDVDIWKAECDESHDAEVIHSAALSRADVEIFLANEPSDFCHEQPIDSRYEPLFADLTYDIYVYVESWDVEDPDPGDRFICVVERLDGQQIDHRLLDDVSPAVGEAGKHRGPTVAG